LCQNIFEVGLNIKLVPANMSRLSCDPCKKKILKSVLAKILILKMVPGPIWLC